MQKTAYEMRISDWSSDVCASGRVQKQLVALADDLDIGPGRLFAKVLFLLVHIGADRRASDGPDPRANDHFGPLALAADDRARNDARCAGLQIPVVSIRRSRVCSGGSRLPIMLFSMRSTRSRVSGLRLTI